MLSIMENLVKRKYKFVTLSKIYRDLDFDKEHPEEGSFAGYLFNLAYARAVFQAAMTIKEKKKI